MLSLPLSVPSAYCWTVSTQQKTVLFVHSRGSQDENIQSEISLVLLLSCQWRGRQTRLRVRGRLTASVPVTPAVGLTTCRLMTLFLTEQKRRRKSGFDTAAAQEVTDQNKN